MNKTIGFIYALWNGIAMLVINMFFSHWFSVDISYFFFVEIIMFLALIWYKKNIDNGENKND